MLRSRTLSSPGRAEQTLDEIQAIIAAVADRDPRPGGVRLPRARLGGGRDRARSSCQ